MQVYEGKIQSLSGDFDLDANITKIEKKELLSLDNPHYKEVLSKYSHLEELKWVMMTRKISSPSG